MQIREAIIQYLALPNTEVLDEEIFYNVLKDLNAFEQISASQHIMRAFVTKGYLKDIWRGKKGWQIQSRHYLIETLGFQPDKVDYVINELEEGFKNMNYDTTKKEVSTTIQLKEASPSSAKNATNIEKTKKSSNSSNNYYGYLAYNLVVFLATTFACSAFCIVHYKEWNILHVLLFIFGDYLFLFFQAIGFTTLEDKRFDGARMAFAVATCLVMGIKSLLPFWYAEVIEASEATILIINCIFLCALSIVGITTEKKDISSWIWTFLEIATIYSIICFGGIHLLYKQIL